MAAAAGWLAWASLGKRGKRGEGGLLDGRAFVRQAGWCLWKAWAREDWYWYSGMGNGIGIGVRSRFFGNSMGLGWDCMDGNVLDVRTMWSSGL